MFVCVYICVCVHVYACPLHAAISLLKPTRFQHLHLLFLWLQHDYFYISAEKSQSSMANLNSPAGDAPAPAQLFEVVGWPIDMVIISWSPVTF